MKRIWKYVILLAVLSALLCMSVFAAEAPTVTNFAGTASVNANKESFTASYDKATAGNQYLILMLAVGEVPESQPDTMPDPTDGNILYINQTAADAAGKVEFKTVYPKAVEDSVIWLIGSEGPVALASVEAPTPAGVTVSGTAVSWNNTDDAVYLLYGSTVEDATIKDEWKAGSYNAAYTGTKGTIAAATVDGKAMQSQGFSFEGVADGSYKLAIFKPGKYVPKIVSVTVSGSNVELGTQKLWLYGDVNYDGRIDATDAGVVLQAFVGSVTFDAEQSLAADVNCDNREDATDATEILKRFVGAASDYDNLK